MKRWFAFLLMAVLMLLGTSALASEDGIWIGDVMLKPGDYLITGSKSPVRSAPEDNYAHYTDDGKTLVLHNFEIEGSYLFRGNLKAGIYSTHALEIIPHGVNQITTNGYGIVVDANALLYIDGAPAIDGQIIIDAVYGGIWSCGNVSLNDVSVNIRAYYGNALFSGISARDTLQASQSEVVINSNGYGISCKTIKLYNYSSADVFGKYLSGIKCDTLAMYESFLTVSTDYVDDNDCALNVKETLDIGSSTAATGWKGTDQVLSMQPGDSYEAYKPQFALCDRVKIKPLDETPVLNVAAGKSRLESEADSQAVMGYRRYQVGDVVHVEANVAPYGMEFFGWKKPDVVTFLTLDNENRTATFEIPDVDMVKLVPDYRPAGTHTCTYTDYEYDDYRHWKSCAATECNAILDYSIEPHVFKPGKTACECGKPAPENVETETRPVPPSGSYDELDKDELDREEIPRYPILVVKKIVGIDASDLPDEIVFWFDIYDSVNGQQVDSVSVSKQDLQNPKCPPITLHVPKEFAIVERYPGYEGIFDMDTQYELVGIKSSDGSVPNGNGETPVGSFVIDENVVEFEPDDDGPQINQLYSTRGIVMDSPKIVITNTLTIRESGLPKTGDESNLVLWACAMLLSGTAGMRLLRKKRDA